MKTTLQIRDDKSQEHLIAPNPSPKASGGRAAISMGDRRSRSRSPPRGGARRHVHPVGTPAASSLSSPDLSLTHPTLLVTLQDAAAAALAPDRRRAEVCQMTAEHGKTLPPASGLVPTP